MVAGLGVPIFRVSVNGHCQGESAKIALVIIKQT